MDFSFNPGSHKHTGQRGPRTDPWEGEWLSPWRRGDACLHQQEGANPDRELGRSGRRIYLGWLPRPPKKPAVLTPNPLHPLADAEGCLL